MLRASTPGYWINEDERGKTANELHLTCVMKTGPPCRCCVSYLVGVLIRVSGLLSQRIEISNINRDEAGEAIFLANLGFPTRRRN